MPMHSLRRLTLDLKTSCISVEEEMGNIDISSMSTLCLNLPTGLCNSIHRLYGKRWIQPPGVYLYPPPYQDCCTSRGGIWHHRLWVQRKNAAEPPQPLPHFSATFPFTSKLGVSVMRKQIGTPTFQACPHSGLSYPPSYETNYSAYLGGVVYVLPEYAC